MFTRYTRVFVSKRGSLALLRATRKIRVGPVRYTLVGD
jgi:hypothetical protein